MQCDTEPVHDTQRDGLSIDNQRSTSPNTISCVPKQKIQSLHALAVNNNPPTHIYTHTCTQMPLSFYKPY